VSGRIPCGQPRRAARARTAFVVAGAIAVGLMLGIASGAVAQGRDGPRWRMNLDTPSSRTDYRSCHRMAVKS
jgi:hypothetical protein